MNKRPKRSVQPPKNLKEYVVVTDLEEEITSLKFQKSEVDLLKEKSSFKCSKCKIVCRSKNEISTHLRKHKGKENFLCEDCGKTLSSLQAFLEHANIHKNLKPYRCEICGHESRQISTHSRHLLTHEKNPLKLFKCTICSKDFRQNEYLRQHMRKHLGEKPYQCNTCSKKFTAKSELNRHLISHSFARPFSCQHCNKKFKLKHNLYAHIRAHSKIQLWKCCLCKASFPQQYLMEKHKQSHTEVVQHLELVKNDPRTISITAFPLDKRKVSHHQKVSLPSKLDLNDTENNFNSKMSLGLNDAFIPLSVIANSFGTGNYIKMKIVDKVNMSVKNSAKRILASSGVSEAVLVEDKISLGSDNIMDECAASPEETKEKNEVSNQMRRESNHREVYFSHLKSSKKIFDKNCLEEIIVWIQDLTGIMDKISLPFDYEIFKSLQSTLVEVQNVILKYSDDSENPGFNDNESTGNYSSANKKLLIEEEKEDNRDVNILASGKDLKVELCNEEVNENSLRKIKDLFKSYTYLNTLINKHFKIRLQL